MDDEQFLRAPLQRPLTYTHPPQCVWWPRRRPNVRCWTPPMYLSKRLFQTSRSGNPVLSSFPLVVSIKRSLPEPAPQRRLPQFITPPRRSITIPSLPPSLPPLPPAPSTSGVHQPTHPPTPSPPLSFNDARDDDSLCHPAVSRGPRKCRNQLHVQWRLFLSDAAGRSTPSPPFSAQLHHPATSAPS